MRAKQRAVITASSVARMVTGLMNKMSAVGLFYREHTIEAVDEQGDEGCHCQQEYAHQLFSESSRSPNSHSPQTSQSSSTS